MSISRAWKAQIATVRRKVRLLSGRKSPDCRPRHSIASAPEITIIRRCSGWKNCRNRSVWSSSTITRTTRTAPSAEDRRRQRKAGLICGLLLFSASSLQQVGLVETSAGKAGFITALYVVLVPVAGWLLFRRNPGRVIWLGVILALLALYLLCIPEGGFRLERGDGLVLGCAVCFTGQILCVDRFAPTVDGLRLSRDQFLVTGVLSLAVALLTETFSLQSVRDALIPLVYTGVFSGGIGYTLQIIGQREVNPTVASLLMSMESVFAVLTGALLLGERMTGRETWGCVLMFSAVILAQTGPWIAGRKEDRGLRVSPRHPGG